MSRSTKSPVVSAGQRRGPRRWLIAAATIATASLAGCSFLMMAMHGHPMEFEAGAKPVDAGEYGFGSRISKGGLYVVEAEAAQPVRVGRIHAMRIEVRTKDGAPVEAATILIDGGMPEHRHGLPTHPEVTSNLGGGLYEVGGMKYNMGGWWVVRVRIDAAEGADEVLFNLNL